MTAPQVAADGAGRTILVVEDEPQIQKLVRFVLAREGFMVLEASNGAEALTVASGHPGTIDLVLSDATMPEMNGPEMVVHLRQARPDVPVIYMSGFTGATLGPAIVETGDDYIKKPMTPGQLMERVRAVLAGHSARRALR
jgi:two-component system cell cycle sensor histidine kinase/response regulator CckA